MVNFFIMVGVSSIFCALPASTPDLVKSYRVNYYQLMKTWNKNCLKTNPWESYINEDIECPITNENEPT